MENKPAHVPDAPRICGIRVCALDNYQCFGPSFRVKLLSKDVQPGLGFVKVLRVQRITVWGVEVRGVALGMRVYLSPQKYVK